MTATDPNELVDLRTAICNHYPGGKRISGTTYWRWVRKGVRGQKLRIQYFGGKAFTCRAWIDDFNRRITEQSLPQQVSDCTDHDVQAAGLT